MSTEFDPYHKWLGIPPSEQPPNHYRLLGIAEYESDLEVIGAAADRQMAHLRTKSSGTYGDLSQKLLNEVAQAKVILLNEDKRTAYDQTLLGPPVAPPAINTEPPVSENSFPNVQQPGPAINVNVNSIKPGIGNQGKSDGLQIDATKKSPRAKKPNSGSRRNILIIQNTIAIALAIVALVSLWLMYPVIAGNGDGDSDGEQSTADGSKNNSGTNNDTDKTNGELANTGNGTNQSNSNTDNGNKQKNPQPKARIFVDLRDTGGKKISVVVNHQPMEVSSDGHYTLEVDAGTSNVLLKRDGYELVTREFNLNGAKPIRGVLVGNRHHRS